MALNEDNKSILRETVLLFSIVLWSFLSDGRMLQGNLFGHLDYLLIGRVYRFLHHLSVDIIGFTGVQLDRGCTSNRWLVEVDKVGTTSSTYIQRVAHVRIVPTKVAADDKRNKHLVHGRVCLI